MAASPGSGPISSTRSATRSADVASACQPVGRARDGTTRRPVRRRKGKPLSPRRAGLMATLCQGARHRYRGACAGGSPSLFPVPVSTVRLEIGFGGGEHMIAGATATPRTGFIGVEPFINGMAKAVARDRRAGLTNIRLFGGDAARLLDWLPPASLAQVDLLYPDPWPKKRHWKRRFVSPANLDRIARVLGPAGSFRFASDIEAYVEWTLSPHCAAAGFRLDGRARRRLAKPFPAWPARATRPRPWRPDDALPILPFNASLKSFTARIFSRIHDPARRSRFGLLRHDLPEGQVRLQGARPSRRAARREPRSRSRRSPRAPVFRGNSSSTFFST